MSPNFHTIRGFILQLISNIFIIKAIPRTDYVAPWIEKPLGGGERGDWGSEFFCPENSFVLGYSQYVDDTVLVQSDPTALNALNFLCHDLAGGFVKGISNYDESIKIGSWKDIIKCSSSQELAPNFVQAYKIQIGPYEYGALAVRIMCLSGTELEAPGSYKNVAGTWGDWGLCASGTAMCGFQAKTQSYQGFQIEDEDSGLNHIRIACCRLCEYDQGLYLDGSKCTACFYRCKRCKGAGENQCTACYFSNSYPHMLSTSTCSPPSPEFQSFYEEAPNGWLAKPATSLIDCGYFTNSLKNLYSFAAEAQAEKAFPGLPPFFRLRVLTRIIKIDDWDGKNIELYVNSRHVFSKSLKSEESVLTGSQCGKTTPEKTFVIEFESFEAYTQEVTIKLTSNLPAGSQGSWGFKDFALSLLRCHSTCQSCTDERATSCLSCYPYAKRNTDNTCSCTETYFQVVSQPCTTTVCSLCSKCSQGCRICSGPDKYQCSSCLDGFTYLKDTPEAQAYCKSCNDLCLTCTGLQDSQCLSCKAPLFHESGGGVEARCVEKCPSGRHEFRNENTCVTKCPEGFWLNPESNSCQTSCAKLDQYQDSGDRTCKNCDVSCARCSGPSKADCQACSGAKYLENSSCVDNCEAGKYGDSKTNTCKLCGADCLSCKTPDQPDFCLSCRDGYYLNQGACVSSCGNNQYVSGKECLFCPDLCLSCKSLSICTACKENYLLTLSNSCSVACEPLSFAYKPQSKCLLKCIEPKRGNTRTWTCDDKCEFQNQYVDQSDNTCKDCHSSCLTCVGPLSTDCVTCCPGKGYFYLGECPENCPDTFYGASAENKCLKCSESCLTCKTPDEPSTCLSCKEPYYLRATQCVQKCQDNEFPNEKPRSCGSCSASCLSCLGPSANECTACPDSFFLTLSKSCSDKCNENSFAFRPSKQCLSICTDPLKGNTRTWTCESECELPNQYLELKSRTCKSCDGSCAECSGPSANECSLCKGNRFFWKGQCLTQCPDGQYSQLAENKCMPCSGSCRTCYSPDGPDICLSCDTPLFLKQGKCVPDCAQSEYKDTLGKTCKACHQACSRCSGDGSANCLACFSPMLHENGESAPGSCLPACPLKKYRYALACYEKCPDGLWGIKQTMTCEKECALESEFKDSSERVCKSCHESCSKCVGAENSSCLSCSASLYRNFELGQTGECLKACEAGRFLDTAANACVHICSAPLFAISGSCKEQCPEPYFPDLKNRICEKCFETCLSCDGPGQNNCKTCQSNLFFDSGRCLTSCPSGKYAFAVDTKNKICKNCHSSCKTCSGPEANKCSSCSQPLYLKQSESTCVECNKLTEVREIRDSLGFCVDCNKAIAGCLECNSNKRNCTKCEQELYLFDADGDGMYELCTECRRATLLTDGAICKLCSSEINGCLECRNNPDSCELCQKGLYRLTTGNRISCTDCKAPLLVKKSDADCALCSNMILGCSECFSAEICSQCLPGFILLNKICIPDCSRSNQMLLTDSKICQDACPPAGYYLTFDTQISQPVCDRCNPSVYCYSCEERPEKCVSCIEGYLLLNYACLLTCPEGYYRHEINGVCSSCPQHQYNLPRDIDKQCYDCKKPCKTCLGAPSNCSSCLEGLFSLKGECQKDCPSGFYPNIGVGICKPCHSACLECSDGFNYSCTKCRQKTFLFAAQCLEKCPNGTYGDASTNQCKQCHYSCRSCKGPDPAQCLDCEETRTFLGKDKAFRVLQSSEREGSCNCKEGFFEKEIPRCVECHYTCKSCGGPSHTDCLNCAGNRGDNSSLPIDGVCECPHNLYDYMKPVCLGPEQQATTISMVKNQQATFTYGSIGSALGFSTLKVFGFLFNILEVAQEISLYSFINTNKPLNLEDLLNYFNEFKFYKHLTIFQKLKLPFAGNKTKTVKPQPIDQEASPIFRKRGISSSFMSNCLSVVVLIIVVPLVAFLLIKIVSFFLKRRGKTSLIDQQENQFKSQRSIKKALNNVWNRREQLMVNIILAMFLGSLQELHFFMVLQDKNISFENTYNSTSFALSVLWAGYELVIIGYLVKVFLDLNPRIKNKFKIKQRFYRFLSRRTKKTNTELRLTAEEKKISYSDQTKENHSYYFGIMLKETPSGMSFLFYRIFKKILLPTIHVSLHENVETLIFTLTVFYAASFLYLRIAEPFRHRASNIVAEVTELGHINFLLFLKFYVQAVDLRNPELALTLGLYMIYSILAIVSLNLCFLLFTFISIGFGKIGAAFQNKKQDIRLLIRRIIGKKETVMVNTHEKAEKGLERELKLIAKTIDGKSCLDLMDNNCHQDPEPDTFSRSSRNIPARLSFNSKVVRICYDPILNPPELPAILRLEDYALDNPESAASKHIKSTEQRRETDNYYEPVEENEQMPQKKHVLISIPGNNEKFEEDQFDDILRNLKQNLKAIGLGFECRDSLRK